MDLMLEPLNTFYVQVITLYLSIPCAKFYVNKFRHLFTKTKNFPMQHMNGSGMNYSTMDANMALQTSEKSE